MTDNSYDIMRAGIRQAKNTMAAADYVASDMADLLKGRLRHVRPDVLAKLKRELRDFNAHTKTWG